MAKKLFVGSLSYNVNDAELQNFFSQAGTVESANVIVDRISGRSRGFGFVEMSSDEEAKTAMETLNGQELDGRKIVVNEAKPMGDKPPRRGGGGGGNRFRGGRNDF
ncbi:RNA-binding protein [Patescibacteria group bacterium]|nr:RNA-binding protein [Patescibacteria group bacterium]